MRDNIKDIDTIAIAEYLKEREPLKPLEDEKIYQIKEIIKICKGLADEEKEKYRYEIRNLCK